MASPLAAYLRSVVFEIPCVHGVVPLLDVDDVVEALTACLQKKKERKEREKLHRQAS